MTREELFMAVGEMEEDFLAENEALAAHSRRIVWRNVLAAAVVTALMVGLAITAAAAWAGTLQGSTKEITAKTVTMVDGKLVETGEMEIMEVYVDLPVTDPASSTAVEGAVYHVPSALGTENLSGFSYSKPFTTDYCLTWGWDDSNRVSFEQVSGEFYYRQNKMVDIMDNPFGVYTFTEEAVLVGELEAYRVCRTTDGGTLGEQYFYWTDGSYVFTLTCPHDMAREEVEEIILSLEPVEDILPYQDIVSEHVQQFAEQMEP